MNTSRMRLYRTTRPIRIHAPMSRVGVSKLREAYADALASVSQMTEGLRSGDVFEPVRDPFHDCMGAGDGDILLAEFTGGRKLSELRDFGIVRNAATIIAYEGSRPDTATRFVLVFACDRLVRDTQELKWLQSGLRLWLVPEARVLGPGNRRQVVRFTHVELHNRSLSRGTMDSLIALGRGIEDAEDQIDRFALAAFGHTRVRNTAFETRWDA